MTRMWLVDPEFLCDQHLLGEHKEMHQEVGQIEAGNLETVKGHVREAQVDTSLLEQRHGELVEEMENRGFNHKSPLDYEDELELGSIDTEANLEDLKQRCEDCRERIEER
ncbi:MAG: pyrimidine dimer DNA glycosylase/endonuclease V [Candidatus Nanohaloarchaeota archaeon QJJ-7]|nr:pyrimidine dimer DNA glycosylase/endonuclease V [Candidatus Nanohaloarchaeota archaeon QJJ-7]